MKWITALKKFNESKPSWCIPRRNTPDHKKVLDMMKGNTPATNITSSYTSSGTKGQQTYNRAISNIERKNKIRQKSKKIRQVLRNY